MIKSKDIDKLLQNDEVVLYDSEIGKIIHKQLFKFDDKVYIDLNLISNFDSSQTEAIVNRPDLYDSICMIINTLNSNNYSNPPNIHILLEWQHMVQLATWRFEIISGAEILSLLSNAGLKINNINSTKYTNIQGIFMYLLKNARFDIFRRVCHVAKKNLIEHINDKSIQVICHLASQETKTIIASSL